MDKKILSKILAVMLVITLTFANFIFLAVYAAEIRYEEQDTNINKTGISFDAYFVSDTGVKTHTKVTEMNNSELKLFCSVSVMKGYLKDAVISIENSNFRLITGEELPEGVEYVDTTNNTITLKQINKGENKEMVLPIEVVQDEQFDLNNFSKEAKVNLKGIFVNDAAKEIKVEKTILVNLALSENAEAYLEGVVSKYVLFEDNGKQKELLQLKVSSKVVDNLLPIKETVIKMVVPKLRDKEPEYVSVVSTSTKATNGNDGTDFGIENYTCENGIISINVSNPVDDNNKVIWLKDVTDEFMINLLYDVETEENQNEVENPDSDLVVAQIGDIEDENSTEDSSSNEEDEIEKDILTMASRLTLYNNEEDVIATGINQEIEIPEVSSEAVSFEIENEVEEIAKGYMLVKDAANTEYTQNIEVNIGYSPIVKNIEINKGREYYSDNTEKQYSATTYYKKIEINKENFVKLLGEDGKIEVIKEEEIIATLNGENTEYEFEEEISEVKMIASEPKAEGTLVIKTQKYIKAAEYDAKITSKFNKITTTMIGKSNISEGESLAETKLVEPTLQVTSSISNNKLSTVVENENVELRVALQTNNNTNRLFKNPIIEIEFPSYIKEVEVKNVNLLYNTELVPTQGEISTNANGNKVITVKLEGEQTKFNEVLSVEGMTLIMGTDLIVDKTTPTAKEEIKVKVTNNKTEVVETNTQIEYVAPAGMILLNSVSGYNEKNEIVTSMSGNEEVGKLTVVGNSRIATQTITVINNYDYICGHINILGRTFTQENRDILSDKNLGSTFTAKMVSTIKAVEGVEDTEVTIYYSENDNATEDIEDSSNGWTTSIENLENVKSYLIVLSKTLEKGGKISFSYDIEIPEGLKREQSTYSMYKVNYTNMDGALQGVKETTKSSVVGISTGEGTELEVDLSANVENGEKVRERQIIEYTVQVKNTGKMIANNVEVLVDIPEYTYYTEKITQGNGEVMMPDPNKKTFNATISTIQPGETKEVSFMLDAGERIDITMEDIINRDDYETEEEYQEALKNDSILELFKKDESHRINVKAKAIVIEDGEEVIFTSNEIANEKVRAYFNLYWTLLNSNTEIGTIKTYQVNVVKIGDKDIHNVKITCPIPKGLKYVETIFSESYYEVKEEIYQDRIVWTIEELKYADMIQVKFEVEEVEEETEVSVQMIGTCDELDGEIKTEIDTFTIGKPKIEVVHTSNNTTGQLVELDEIVYVLTVKNVSNVNAYDVRITDYVSDGLNLKTVKYNNEGQVWERQVSGESASIILHIPARETITIEITATADLLDLEETTKTVSNMFEVEEKYSGKTSSSVITHVVNKKEYASDDNGTKHSISGLAWIDSNSNGIRELDETRLPDIPVMLLNTNGNKVASSFTSASGTYIFNNLAKGSYIVAFLYDMSNYDVTLYHIGDTSTDNDAVSMDLSIKGINTQCAATNVINLDQSNITNIDLGLTVSPKFDLSLSKTISKITVQTSKRVQTTNYNNSRLQKIEIPSDEMKKATVAIEYLITVKNEGAISGYAKTIVDYLSTTDLKFNSETNSDWYLGTDGNLYNSTLANTLLQPGESRTLKLVLTKKVTENNTGLTNNTAEIYEAFNDEGIEDYNSNPANKASNENDLGQADIIIGPKTGVILYIGIILIFMVILTTGIYVLNKEIRKT